MCNNDILRAFYFWKVYATNLNSYLHSVLVRFFNIIGWGKIEISNLNILKIMQIQLGRYRVIMSQNPLISK